MGPGRRCTSDEVTATGGHQRRAPRSTKDRLRTPRRGLDRAERPREQAGFEPEASGRRQGYRDDYAFGPEAADSLGVVRDAPSPPTSGYPTGAEEFRSFPDHRRTAREHRAAPTAENQFDVIYDI